MAENPMQPYELRIELWCGDINNQGSIRRAQRRYEKADAVAKKFGIPTNFQFDGMYADGYMYPSSDNVVAVLRALDSKRVEYDYVDLPKELKGSALHRTLIERFWLSRPEGPAEHPLTGENGVWTGVEVTIGELEARRCGVYAEPFEGFGFRRPNDWHRDGPVRVRKHRRRR